MLIAACRGTEASLGAGVSRVDSAGVEVVINTSPAWNRDSAWRVDTVPLTVIGGRDPGRAQQFAYVVGARRLSDGRVVVVTDRDVRWFGVDGAFLYANGATGDGPGEFRARTTLLRKADDTVVVADALGARVATFNRAGTLVRDERLDRARFAALGRWEECASELLPDGSRYTCSPDPSIPRSPTNRPRQGDGHGRSSPGAGLLRQLKRTYLVPASLDTAYPIGLVGGIEQFGFRHGTSGTIFLPHPFYSRSLLSAGGSPMRVATILNPEYRIELWTPSGQLARVVRRVQARRVPTTTERQRADEYTREQGRRGIAPAILEAALAAMPLPDSLPAATSLVVSETGEIFVGRDPWFGAVSSVDVFDASGRWLGTLTLPARSVIVDAGLDFLLILHFDGDDVPSVEVLRLDRPGAPAKAAAGAPD